MFVSDVGDLSKPVFINYEDQQLTMTFWLMVNTEELKANQIQNQLKLIQFQGDLIQSKGEQVKAVQPRFKMTL